MRRMFILLLAFAVILMMIPTTALADGDLNESAGPESPIDAGGEEEDSVTIPMGYSTIYEPDTSWAMAATVAWRADGTLLDVAKQAVRPATAFVWLDLDLRVYDRSRSLISESLDQFLAETAGTVIPAFYLETPGTAAALKAWLSETGFRDCFVVATPGRKELVKDVAELLHVRGMLDYTDIKEPDRSDIADMIASVNEAHGKVILLSREAATKENIRQMQALCTTVWVQTPADTRSLVTLYTSGVNGVVVDDYEAAIQAEEFFRDDAPTLLRLPRIVGHRGDPSNYVENTLDSALGAFEEGADSVETDIHLTWDGELVIRHDSYLGKFIGLDAYISDMTADEIMSYTFDWYDEYYGIPYANEVDIYDDTYGRRFGGSLYGQNEEKEYCLPTYRQYLETFKGKEIVLDTEIKSTDPAILPLFKQMVDEYDAWDQIFPITFNKTILETMYTEYPELPVGALIMSAPEGDLYGTYQEIEDQEGAEAALERLYGELDQWNANYNPMNWMYGDKMVELGRHRGLTVRAWTYNLSTDQEAFARDFLKGLHGLTVDQPWITSDYIAEITAEDVTVRELSDVPKPTGITRIGNTVVLDQAELVEVENLIGAENKKLMIWRCRMDLDIDGKSWGTYYLYSNPFEVVLEESAGTKKR